MKIFQNYPSEKITYKTPLSKEEVLRILSENVEKSTHFWDFLKKTEKPYRGKIFSENFEIQRVIRYRNSFLPIINGEIQQKNTHTEIHIKMQMILFVQIFLIIWFSIVFVMLFSVFFSVFFLKETSIWSVVLPLFFLTFGFALSYFGFTSETKKSKNWLQQIFQATEKMK